MVPVGHILVGADGDHLADFSAVDDIFQSVVELGIAQHMAENNVLVRVLGGHLQHPPALADFRGNGLFHQHMVAPLQGGNGVVHMLAVHGRNHHYIGQAGLGQHFLAGGETVFLGNIIKFLGFFDLVGV